MHLIDFVFIAILVTVGAESSGVYYNKTVEVEVDSGGNYYLGVNSKSYKIENAAEFKLESGMSISSYEFVKMKRQVHLHSYQYLPESEENEKRMLGSSGWSKNLEGKRNIRVKVWRIMWSMASKYAGECISTELMRELLFHVDYAARIWSGNRVSVDAKNSFISDCIYALGETDYYYESEAPAFVSILQERVPDLPETRDNYASVIYMIGRVRVTAGGWAGMGIVSNFGTWSSQTNTKWTIVNGYGGYPNCPCYSTALVHEMHHNMGFSHSGRIEVSKTGQFNNFELSDGYGDHACIMGAGAWYQPITAKQYYYNVVGKDPESWFWKKLSDVGNNITYRLYAFDHPYSRHYLGIDKAYHTDDEKVGEIPFKYQGIAIELPFNRSNMISTANQQYISTILEYRYIGSGQYSWKDKSVRVLWGPSTNPIKGILDDLLDADIDGISGGDKGYGDSQIPLGVKWVPRNIDIGTMSVLVKRIHWSKIQSNTYENIGSEEKREYDEPQYVEIEIDYQPGEKYTKPTTAVPFPTYEQSPTIANCVSDENAKTIKCEKYSESYWFYSKPESRKDNVPRVYSKEVATNGRIGFVSYLGKSVNPHKHCFGETINHLCVDITTTKITSNDISNVNIWSSVNVYTKEKASDPDTSYKYVNHENVLYAKVTLADGDKLKMIDLYGNEISINNSNIIGGYLNYNIPDLKTTGFSEIILLLTDSNGKVKGSNAFDVYQYNSTARIAFYKDVDDENKYILTSATIPPNLHSLPSMMNSKLMKANEKLIYPIVSLNKNDYIYIDFEGVVPSGLSVKIETDNGDYDLDLSKLGGNSDVSYKLSCYETNKATGGICEYYSFTFNKNVTLLNIRAVMMNKYGNSFSYRSNGKSEYTFDGKRYKVEINEIKSTIFTPFKRTIGGVEYEFDKIDRIYELGNNKIPTIAPTPKPEEIIPIILHQSESINKRIMEGDKINSCRVEPDLPAGISLSDKCELYGVSNGYMDEETYRLYYRENEISKEVLISIIIYNENVECSYGVDENTIRIAGSTRFKIEGPKCNGPIKSFSVENLPVSIKFNESDGSLYTIGSNERLNPTNVIVYYETDVKKKSISLTLSIIEEFVESYSSPVQHLEYISDYLILMSVNDVYYIPSYSGKITECKSLTKLPDGIMIDNNNCKINSTKDVSENKESIMFIQGKNQYSSSTTRVRIVQMKSDEKNMIEGWISNYYKDKVGQCNGRYRASRYDSVLKYSRIEDSINYEEGSMYWPELGYKLEQESFVSRKGIIFSKTTGTWVLGVKGSGSTHFGVSNEILDGRSFIPSCDVKKAEEKTKTIKEGGHMFFYEESRDITDKPLSNVFYVGKNFEGIPVGTILDKKYVKHLISNEVEYKYSYAIYPRNVKIPDNNPLFLYKDKKYSFISDKVLPSGLKLDMKSGIISGTPRSVVEVSEYKIEVRNTENNEVFMIKIHIGVEEIKESNPFNCEINNKEILQYNEITPINCSKSDVEGYYYSSRLPKGLEISENGIISGIATEVVDNMKVTVYRYTPNSLDKADIVLTVKANTSKTNWLKLVYVSENDCMVYKLSHNGKEIFTSEESMKGKRYEIIKGFTDFDGTTGYKLEILGSYNISGSYELLINGLTIKNEQFIEKEYLDYSFDLSNEGKPKVNYKTLITPLKCGSYSYYGPSSIKNGVSYFKTDYIPKGLEFNSETGVFDGYVNEILIGKEVSIIAVNPNGESEVKIYLTSECENKYPKVSYESKTYRIGEEIYIEPVEMTCDKIESDNLPESLWMNEIGEIRGVLCEKGEYLINVKCIGEKVKMNNVKITVEGECGSGEEMIKIQAKNYIGDYLMKLNVSDTVEKKIMEFNPSSVESNEIYTMCKCVDKSKEYILYGECKVDSNGWYRIYYGDKELYKVGNMNKVIEDRIEVKSEKSLPNIIYEYSDMLYFSLNYEEVFMPIKIENGADKIEITNVDKLPSSISFDCKTGIFSGKPSEKFDDVEIRIHLENSKTNQKRDKTVKLSSGECGHHRMLLDYNLRIGVNSNYGLKADELGIVSSSIKNKGDVEIYKYTKENTKADDNIKRLCVLKGSSEIILSSLDDNSTRWNASELIISTMNGVEIFRNYKEGNISKEVNVNYENYVEKSEISYSDVVQKDEKWKKDASGFTKLESSPLPDLKVDKRYYVITIDLNEMNMKDSVLFDLRMILNGKSIMYMNGVEFYESRSETASENDEYKILGNIELLNIGLNYLSIEMTTKSGNKDNMKLNGFYIISGNNNCGYNRIYDYSDSNVVTQQSGISYDQNVYKMFDNNYKTKYSASAKSVDISYYYKETESVYFNGIIITTGSDINRVPTSITLKGYDKSNATSEIVKESGLKNIIKVPLQRYSFEKDNDNNNMSYYGFELLSDGVSGVEYADIYTLSCKHHCLANNEWPLTAGETLAKVKCISGKTDQEMFRYCNSDLVWEEINDIRCKDKVIEYGELNGVIGEEIIHYPTKFNCEKVNHNLPKSLSIDKNGVIRGKFYSSYTQDIALTCEVTGQASVDHVLKINVPDCKADESVFGFSVLVEYIDDLVSINITNESNEAILMIDRSSITENELFRMGKCVKSGDYKINIVSLHNEIGWYKIYYENDILYKFGRINNDVHEKVTLKRSSGKPIIRYAYTDKLYFSIDYEEEFIPVEIENGADEFSIEDSSLLCNGTEFDKTTGTISGLSRLECQSRTLKISAKNSYSGESNSQEVVEEADLCGHHRYLVGFTLVSAVLKDANKKVLWSEYDRTNARVFDSSAGLLYTFGDLKGEIDSRGYCTIGGVGKVTLSSLDGNNWQASDMTVAASFVELMRDYNHDGNDITYIVNYNNYINDSCIIYYTDNEQTNDDWIISKDTTGWSSTTKKDGKFEALGDSKRYYKLLIDINKKNANMRDSVLFDLRIQLNGKSTMYMNGIKFFENTPNIESDANDRISKIRAPIEFMQIGLNVLTIEMETVKSQADLAKFVGLFIVGGENKCAYTKVVPTSVDFDKNSVKCNPDCTITGDVKTNSIYRVFDQDGLTGVSRKSGYIRLNFTDGWSVYFNGFYYASHNSEITPTKIRFSGLDNEGKYNVLNDYENLELDGPYQRYGYSEINDLPLMPLNGFEFEYSREDNKDLGIAEIAPYTCRQRCFVDGEWKPTLINSFLTLKCKKFSSYEKRRYCNDDFEWDEIEDSKCPKDSFFKLDELEYEVGKIIIKPDMNCDILSFADLPSELSFNEKSGTIFGEVNKPNEYDIKATCDDKQLNYKLKILSCKNGYRSILLRFLVNQPKDIKVFELINSNNEVVYNISNTEMKSNEEIKYTNCLKSDIYTLNIQSNIDNNGWYELYYDVTEMTKYGNIKKNIEIEFNVKTENLKPYIMYEYDILSFKEESEYIPIEIENGADVMTVEGTIPAGITFDDKKGIIRGKLTTAGIDTTLIIKTKNTITKLENTQTIKLTSQCESGKSLYDFNLNYNNIDNAEVIVTINGTETKLNSLNKNADFCVNGLAKVKFNSFAAYKLSEFVLISPEGVEIIRDNLAYRGMEVFGVSLRNYLSSSTVVYYTDTIQNNEEWLNNNYYKEWNKGYNHENLLSLSSTKRYYNIPINLNGVEDEYKNMILFDLRLKVNGEIKMYVNGVKFHESTKSSTTETLKIRGPAKLFNMGENILSIEMTVKEGNKDEIFKLDSLYFTYMFSQLRNEVNGVCGFSKIIDFNEDGVEGSVEGTTDHPLTNIFQNDYSKYATVNSNTGYVSYTYSSTEYQYFTGIQYKAPSDNSNPVTKFKFYGINEDGSTEIIGEKNELSLVAYTSYLTSNDALPIKTYHGYKFEYEGTNPINVGQVLAVTCKTKCPKLGIWPETAPGVEISLPCETDPTKNMTRECSKAVFWYNVDYKQCPKPTETPTTPKTTTLPPTTETPTPSPTDPQPTCPAYIIPKPTTPAPSSDNIKPPPPIEQATVTLTITLENVANVTAENTLNEEEIKAIKLSIMDMYRVKGIILREIDIEVKINSKRERLLADNLSDLELEIVVTVPPEITEIKGKEGIEKVTKEISTNKEEMQTTIKEKSTEVSDRFTQITVAEVKQVTETATVAPTTQEPTEEPTTPNVETIQFEREIKISNPSQQLDEKEGNIVQLAIVKYYKDNNIIVKYDNIVVSSSEIEGNMKIKIEIKYSIDIDSNVIQKVTNLLSSKTLVIEIKAYAEEYNVERLKTIEDDGKEITEPPTTQQPTTQVPTYPNLPNKILRIYLSNITSTPLNPTEIDVIQQAIIDYYNESHITVVDVKIDVIPRRRRLLGSKEVGNMELTITVFFSENVDMNEANDRTDTLIADKDGFRDRIKAIAEERGIESLKNIEIDKIEKVDTGGNEDSNNTAIIVGCVVGGVVLIGIIVVGAILYVRYNQRKKYIHKAGKLSMSRSHEEKDLETTVEKIGEAVEDEAELAPINTRPNKRHSEVQADSSETSLTPIAKARALQKKRVITQVVNQQEVYKPFNYEIIMEGYLMKQGQKSFNYNIRYCVLYYEPAVLRIYGSMTPSYYGNLYTDEKQSIPLECYSGIEYKEGSSEFTLVLKVRDSSIKSFEPGDKERKVNFKVEGENAVEISKRWVECFRDFKSQKPRKENAEIQKLVIDEDKGKITEEKSNNKEVLMDRIKERKRTLKEESSLK